MKEINQTLRNALFDNEHKTRNKARRTFFQQHIYNVDCTSYRPQFCITHKCIGEKDQETLKTGIPESLFKEKEPNCLHWARHKDAMTSERASCSDKTVSNPYPPQIL